MTKEEFDKIETGLRDAYKVTADDLQITLEKQQTQRHGLRITNQFTASHNGGDFFNLMLEEVLNNQEDVLIAAIRKLAKDKYEQAKIDRIKYLEDEALRLKG